jgi:hypothetical protein
MKRSEKKVFDPDFSDIPMFVWIISLSFSLSLFFFFNIPWLGNCALFQHLPFFFQLVKTFYQNKAYGM